MKTRIVFWVITALGAGLILMSLRAADTSIPDRQGNPSGGRVVKTDEEWKSILTPRQFEVTRRGGTERSFTGQYWNDHSEGTYVCVCCGQPLFESQAKFESGTGWPSFFQPADSEAISTRTDRGWMGPRSELLCSRCDAHLGHVFPDGPKPTGLRYCINSAALKLIPKTKSYR